MRELTGWSKGLRVTADGDGVVAMVGVAGLRMLADRTGLTASISTVLAKPGFHPVHDRGRVLTDIACSIAAGGTDVYDIEAGGTPGDHAHRRDSRPTAMPDEPGHPPTTMQAHRSSTDVRPAKNQGLMQGLPCHTCGRTGVPNVGDHQPPTGLSPIGGPQRLYPQCEEICSTGNQSRAVLIAQRILRNRGVYNPNAPGAYERLLELLPSHISR